MKILVTGASGLIGRALTTELNAYDVLCSDWVVFSQDSLPATEGGAK